MPDEKDAETAEERRAREAREKQEEKRQKRRAGIAALVLFATASLFIVLVVGWADGWDRVFVARDNPQVEDAYAWSTERPLQARFAGYVTAVLIDDNQRVAAGQPIVRIEDDNYRASVDRARADLARETAMLEATRRQRDAAAIMVAQSGARTRATEASQHFADQEYARQREILPTELGLLRATQRADADRRAVKERAQADVDATQQRQSDLHVLDATIALDQAQVEAAQAALDLAEIELGYTVLRAPVAGTLGVRQVHVGDLLTVGQTVATLTPLRDIWVQAFFKETQMDQVRIGQAVAVRFDAYLDTQLIGHVAEIGPLTLQRMSLVEPDNTTGNYTKVVQRVPVKIALDNAADPLLGLVHAGMSAIVRVRTSAPVDVVTAR